MVRADDEIDCAAGLQGRAVTVRRSSPYWQALVALQEKGGSFKIEPAPEDMETEELIELVASGEIDATVADGHLLDIELARGLPVKSGFKLSDDRAHAVAVRAENKKLLAALNRFIKKQYKGVVYNILYKKYFTNKRNIRDLAAGRLGGEEGGSLSPYDEAMQKYAEKYGFDWRLIAAQMYQESRFDPNAKSFAGAQGLIAGHASHREVHGFQQNTTSRKMAFMPASSTWTGCAIASNPTLPFNERMWFTLAAYNAGHGHVEDARRLARQQGLGRRSLVRQCGKGDVAAVEEEVCKQGAIWLCARDRAGQLRTQYPPTLPRLCRDRGRQAVAVRIRGADCFRRARPGSGAVRFLEARSRPE